MFSRRGASVLDADRITHELLQPGTAVARRIKARFGAEVLAPGGGVDRKRLAARVFGSPRRLKELTGIIHPAVRARIREQVAKIRRRKPGAVVVLDIPLLLESGGRYKTDAVVVVSAPFRTSARRLKARSGWSPAEVKRRSSFQMPLSQKEGRADFVVHNGGSLQETRRQVAEVWKQIVQGERLNGGR